MIALLSERITGLGGHFTAHKSDHSSRRGLVKMVNQRKLLDYLKSTKPQKISGSRRAAGTAPLADNPFGPRHEIARPESYVAPAKNVCLQNSINRRGQAIVSIAKQSFLFGSQQVTISKPVNLRVRPTAR